MGEAARCGGHVRLACVGVLKHALRTLRLLNTKLQTLYASARKSRNKSAA
jgi:hypothetical protein